MKARLSLGALLSVAAVVMAIYSSGGAVSPGPLSAALAFVVLVPVIAAIAGFGLKGLANAFGLALSGETVAGVGSAGIHDEYALGVAASVFAFLKRATAGAAVAGFLLVQIMMMYDLRDKDDVRLYLSFSFVPALVGLIVVASLYVPLEYAVANEANRPDGEPTPEPVRGARPGLRILAGFAVCLAVVYACFQALSIGRLPPLLNPPSVIITAFFTLGNLLAGPGLGGMARAFAAVGRRGPGGNAVSASRQAATAFSYLCRSFLLSGGVAFMTGVVYFLQGLNDRMRYGPTMALALVAMFQAVFLLVCVGLPLKAAAGVQGSR